MHIIPNAFFGAFAEGEVLPVLLLSRLLRLRPDAASARPASRCSTASKASRTCLFAAFGFIMRLAPLGAFGAMAFTVGKLRHQVDRLARAC